MDNKVFREKSLNRISSPEDLNSYMKVTNPPTWIAIAVVILILAGALVWSIFGTLESKIDCVLVSDGEAAVCYISEEDISNLDETMPVRTDAGEYSIASIGRDAVTAESVLNDYALHLADYQRGEYVYCITLNEEIAPGNYSCEIITESIPAIYFLLGSSN